MEIGQLYKDIINRRELWNYYNKDIKAPIITDANDCYQFIKEYIKYAEKSEMLLFENVKKLKDYSPQRLSHILSTFFLGLWFYHHKKSTYLHKSIKEELKRLNCFQNDYDEIDRQFAYVWFMATLFHDLGYPAEEEKDGTTIPYHIIPFVGSVPEFYRTVYSDYYTYRDNKEHGIYAGLTFDRDVCNIRSYQYHASGSQLDWKEELDELYHYVAWIILSHNIWMKRDNDKKIEEYKNAGLNSLIMSSIKNGDDDHYIEYKIKFEEYPLYTLFCIIDTIEPLKSTSCLSEIDMRLEGKKIIIKSNDSVYRQKVLGLNEWLLSVIQDDNKVIISLNY